MLLQTTLRHLGAGWWMIALVLLAVVGTGEASAQEDKVVATINNENITQSDFFWQLQIMRGSDFMMPTNPPSMRSETAGYIVLNSMIVERLILQLAAKNHLLPTDADVNAEMDPLLKQATVAQALKDHEVRIEDLKYKVRVQKARFNLAANGTTATPGEIENFYQKNIDSYTTPERWGLAAIRTSKLADATLVENALAMGKQFGDLAKIYSEDVNTRGNGGNIGVVDAGDPQLPQPIRDEVKNLKAGGVTRPIEADFTQPDGTASKVYWIIKMMLKQPQSVLPLAQVRPQVERLAILSKVGGWDAADKKILDFRNSSDIKINLPGYDHLLNKPSPPK